MEYINELALNYRCEYCLAGVGVWCRTNRGAVATALHHGRTDPLYLARNEGWHMGIEENLPSQVAS